MRGMTLRRIFEALIVLAGVCVAAPNAWCQAPSTDTQVSADTRAAVDELIRKSGTQVSVAYRSLDGTRELFIQADHEFPASPQWVEIPVMIALESETQARRAKPGNTILVENRFHSAADGSVYRLDSGLDPDRALYGEIGKRVSLSDLETHMMKENSQLATNLMIESLGIAQINARMADLNANGVRLAHGFQDTLAEKAGKQNTVTARGMMEVMWALATDRAVSAEASQKMMGLIANSRTATSGPFAADQGGTATAKNFEEAVVVYGARSFALGVEVQGRITGAGSAALIARISHVLAETN
jgi:beta-lactamase class A